MTTCDFCSAQACICATGATPVKHQTESAPLSKISTFDRRMEQKKCVGDGIKREKTKAPLMWLPERKSKVRKEWTVNTVTVQAGFKKKNRLEEGTSQMCA